MHIYSKDETIYYGNIIFAYVIWPMSEEEYIDFVHDNINKHFPNLKDKKLHIVWE